VTSSVDLPRSPAVARNRDAILRVLLEELRGSGSVLEIGSGTGEHAVYFAPHLDWLTWQTSDRAPYHAGINAWIDLAGHPNLRRPLILDVNDAPPLERQYDAVFSANTAHIMSIDEVAKMFTIVASGLTDGGRFCLYGPFSIDGRHTSDSNARFDASLRAQDPAMGIRDLGHLDRLGSSVDLVRDRLLPMPANNFIAIWNKS
jgi:cyclopropane fatty-acyl-phospholipid synthase-like methyltransferase